MEQNRNSAASVYIDNNFDLNMYAVEYPLLVILSIKACDTK